ncbi:MAG: acyl-CoA dehydrogenase family protein [Rhodoblastus sp.]|nr:acyl-CoA dehydrogenase family protein [Rhodoblastus sp.]MCB1525412.1 acyl-CoA dehydrogenase family protein [Rhodoblastus sp.]MCC0000476.1 acyl-CoA dehydrogenase family protein [Methylobacteriaceae bacterium]MCO5085419.1 acyl-CoA dehydrogenase family protein [Methylobacteriaceae bacterium]HPG02191.1 acyl-CoA dehydrogenase family protein [Rhodoblastus sp.]
MTAGTKSLYYDESHEAFRDTVRRFVEKEISPFVDEWDEAGGFPRELYKKAADVGILGLGYPEEYGGSPCDQFHRIVLSQELARSGAGGVSASLMSHTIGSPPILAVGPQAMKERVLPQVLSGEKISALAITEPSGGSDVAQLKTTARREGDHYIVNGSKMFITSGVRADFYTVAVRTGGPGASGVSLLLIERGMEGFTQQPLRKMGWWASDTAQLFFDDVKVPVENLIGEENKGFRYVMLNFNSERLGMAASCTAYSRVCLEESIAWARERKVFGGRLADQQVVRHKIVDMAMKVNATQAWLEQLAWRVQQGESPAAEIAMLKNQATQTMAFCASEGVQIHGGQGFMRGTKVERIYREVKVNAIGGGAEEIMKDLAARQMGI